MENPSGIGAAPRALGLTARGRGEVGRAGALPRESLALRRSLGERLGIAECLEGRAAVEVGIGRPERAACWLGAAAFAATRAEGQAMARDEAVAFALADETAT